MKFTYKIGSLVEFAPRSGWLEEYVGTLGIVLGLNKETRYAYEVFSLEAGKIFLANGYPDNTILEVIEEIKVLVEP